MWVTSTAVVSIGDLGTLHPSTSCVTVVVESTEYQSSSHPRPANCLGPSLLRFFLLKFKVETVYISPHATEEEKNHLVHQFNFSKTIKLLLFNTRAGHLPLPPIGIDNIYFYEDEILPAARQIFDEDTVWRINPKER